MHGYNEYYCQERDGTFVRVILGLLIIERRVNVREKNPGKRKEEKELRRYGKLQIMLEIKR